MIGKLIYLQGKTRVIKMNKIIKTRVGDEIHYYVNGVESYGVVAKMSASFVTIFKEDGLFYEVPLTDTFFVKDILINKTWNDMSMEERADQLVKIKAYSPRFLGKSWEQLPPELREVMKVKNGALPKHEGQSHGEQSTAAKLRGREPHEIDRKRSDSFKPDGTPDQFEGLESYFPKPTVAVGKRPSGFDHRGSEADASIIGLNDGSKKAPKGKGSAKDIALKKALEALYKQKFENYFGNDEKIPTTKRSVERKPQESKIDPETSKKIDQVRSRREWGRGQQAKRKKLGVETVDTKHIGTDGKTSFNNRHDRDSFDNIHDVLTGKKNVKLYEHPIKKLKKSLEALYKAERTMNKLISPIQGKPSSTGMTTGSHSGLHKKVQIKVPKDLLEDKEFQGRVGTSVGGKLHDEKGDFSFNPKKGKSVYTDDNGETHYTIERDADKDKGGRNVTGKYDKKKPKPEKKRIDDKPTEPSDAQLELKKLMLARAAKSDQEQGLYGTAGNSSNVGISTDTKIDADKEYEGESHEDKKEEFKYEDEKPKVDQDKNKAVPLSQLNTWGIRYMTKEEREKFNSGQ